MKREIVAQQRPVLRRPIVISVRAENIGQSIDDPMTIAPPYHFTRCAADDIGRDRPPGSPTLDADSWGAPIWIMRVKVGDAWFSQVLANCPRSRRMIGLGST